MIGTALDDFGVVGLVGVETESLPSVLGTARLASTYESKDKSQPIENS